MPDFRLIVIATAINDDHTIEKVRQLTDPLEMAVLPEACVVAFLDAMRGDEPLSPSNIPVVIMPPKDKAN
ncbi:MAG: hypothetical protein V4559_08380 [Pseudomonadota bacterium]